MSLPPTTIEENKAIGESEAFLAMQERISLAAKTDRPLIFIGERGTGKELAAERLHLLSRRWNQPYVTLNCAALTPSLIESELFGHEAGAFTGAVRLRKGRFEMAGGGSLFLDEVANIPLTVQEKILRTVEYGQMERVGGSSTLRVDTRLIAATNVDLRLAARQGSFRQDLLDRLSFEVITLPPLRERKEDILLLAEHFSRRMSREMERETLPEFSEAARIALLEYRWPGNIRELKNVVERMVYRAEEGLIDEIQFDPFDSPFTPEGGMVAGAHVAADLAAGPGGDGEAPRSDAARGMGGEMDSLPLPLAVRALEIRRIRQALRACQFNQRKAAEALGLTYHQLRGYVRKYGDELTR